MGLDTIELVLQIEEEFEIQISSETAQRIETVGDLARCIEALSVKQSKPVQFNIALNRIIEMLVDDFAVDRKLINSGSRIVRDLGLD